MEQSVLLHRVVISTSDLTRALVFYRSVLGLETVSEGGGLAMLRCSGGVEILLHERPSRPSDTGVCISLRLADLAAAVEQWRDLGGTVVDPPARQPWGEEMAMVRDADGHLVCLTSMN